MMKPNDIIGNLLANIVSNGLNSGFELSVESAKKAHHAQFDLHNAGVPGEIGTGYPAADRKSAQLWRRFGRQPYLGAGSYGTGTAFGSHPEKALPVGS